MKPVDKNTARIGFFGDKYEFEAVQKSTFYKQL